MTSRRWLLLTIAAIAISLLAGRVVSGWYVDYHWYALHGASRLWWARTIDLAVLRGAAFVVAAAFAFANLLAVRHSVHSLRLPRRVGNIEFSEEVSARILNGAVAALAVVIGLVLAAPHSDWQSVELIRSGQPFGETDPYFRLDLGTWLYQLPLESGIHVWALVGLVGVTLLVAFLYALTPSLRWEGGRLQVSGYVRRHLFMIAGLLLVLLGWSYRLDALALLHEGTGPLGALSAVDHRVTITANLALSIGAFALAALVTWMGWIGQTRIAFVAITVMLMSALAVRQVVPAVGGRFVTAADADAQEQSYREIRNAYTRRAYGVDQVERTAPDSAAPPFDDAMRGASLWDGEAMRRVIASPRPGARPNGSLSWQAIAGRLTGFVLQHPVGAESAESLPVWGLVRVAADVTDERGGPLARDEPELDAPLRGVLVHDSAYSYFVLDDTAGVVLARPLDSFAARLAHAWHLQNPALLRRRAGEPARRLLLRRDVRDRLAHLYPFFAQGSRVTPFVWRDSVFWAVHLYASSDWYPLSLPLELRGERVRYARHAAVAIVNAHTGRVTAVPSDSPGPLGASWVARFPEQFTPAKSFESGFLERIPPPFDAAVITARALAHAGFRGEFDTRAHLPPQGTDSLFVPADPAPWLDRSTGAVSIVIPLLDPTDNLRGVVVAGGGASPAVRWMRDASTTVKWSRAAADLQAAGDTLRGAAGTRPLLGAVRVIPTRDGLVMIQTHYLTRPDGTPQVLLAALRRGERTAIGRTLMEAAGLPDPVVASTPLTPEEFRGRVAALYESMRDAMRRGDWAGIGAAYEALGRLLRAPRQP